MKRCGAIVLVVAVFLVVMMGAGSIADDSTEVTTDQLLDTITSLQERLRTLERAVARLEILVDSLQAQISTHGWTQAFTVGSDTDNHSSAGQSGTQDRAGWKPIGRGWEYRNALLLESVDESVKFIAEIRRTHDHVKAATFMVTLYDAAESIVATGSSVILDVDAGDIRTAEFILEGNPLDAEAFRLQVDTEI